MVSWNRSLSRLSYVSIGHRPRPAPPDTAADAPAATGQNGKVRLFRGDQLLTEKNRPGPSRARDAGIDRLQLFRAERARPVAQAAAAAAAAGTAPHPPFAFAFPLLPPLLPGGVSTLLLFLSPLLPISGRGTLLGEGGWGPLG